MFALISYARRKCVFFLIPAFAQDTRAITQNRILSSPERVKGSVTCEDTKVDNVQKPQSIGDTWRAPLELGHISCFWRRKTDAVLHEITVLMFFFSSPLIYRV